MSRAQRHAILAEILREHPGSTQERLVADLARAGISVTQATVSRDLAVLGALRGPDGYRLPGDAPAPDATSLSRAMRDHALGFDLAAAIVVVRTAPGHAPVLASELDAARPEGMVGCIAGDDTVFIATPSESAAADLLGRLSATGTEPAPRTLNGTHA